MTNETGEQSAPRSVEVGAHSRTVLSELPDWWREAIIEFREHGLPPYQPPRFKDGALKHEVVEELEQKHDVEIDFIGIDTVHNEDWTVRVDGNPIGEIVHTRSSDRASLYGLSSDEFVEWVEEHIDDTGQ